MLLFPRHSRQLSREQHPAVSWDHRQKGFLLPLVLRGHNLEPQVGHLLPEIVLRASIENRKSFLFPKRN